VHVRRRPTIRKIPFAPSVSLEEKRAGGQTCPTLCATCQKISHWPHLGLCLDFGCDVLKYLQSWESSAICACKYANARAKRLFQVCLMLKDRHVVPAAFATAIAQGRAVLVGGMWLDPASLNATILTMSKTVPERTNGRLCFYSPVGIIELAFRRKCHKKRTGRNAPTPRITADP